ncbi:MAG: transporter [Herminiimonas sp.]|nr:transporter [Herminiimonas sp.]
MDNNNKRWRIIGCLGFTQITSWGSLFYAFAILAPDLQAELGWRADLTFGGFSWCLLVAGLAAAPAGILIDRLGGRIMMSAGSAACGAGFVLLSSVQSPLEYYAAWTLLGIAMALVLYEAAFATINREFIEGARAGITTLTLFGGFASTVFWPLTLKLNEAIGWRETYFWYGMAQFALCLPLHMTLSARRINAAGPIADSLRPGRSYSLKEAVRHPSFWMLACAFATNSFIFSALAVHMIPLFHKLGHPIATVVLFAAFIGPMQVAGRIGEMLFARHMRPQTSGKLTFAFLPAALLILLLMSMHLWAIAIYCMLYGLSNGILTIVRGTVPQAMFGRENYGAIAGALAGPTLIAKAAGPLAIAVLIELGFMPHALLTALLLLSVVSLGFYLAAVRRSDTVDTVERAGREPKAGDIKGDSQP